MAVGCGKEPVAGTITLPLNSVGRPQIVAKMQRLNISTENVAGPRSGTPRFAQRSARGGTIRSRPKTFRNT
ncbi:MAG: hypothetical protein CM1200mP36_01830 [Gammaproteobacteria bacterium]|nr:MAG: hypothetical protein CM1200mP36_01830 [Gammaproteobacteria bacterium]